MNTRKLFSNLAETGVRLTILSTMLMVALIGTVAPAVAQGTVLNLNDYTLSSYGGTQDGACGSGSAIEDGGITLHLTGNCWKQIDFAYNVTSNTILEFDFQSGTEGEIHGIGFDTDNTINNPIQVFQLYGTQSWGLLDFNDYAGETPKHYTIPVGQFYTGSFTSMTFTNDSDAGPIGESIFSNIQVYEGTPPPVPMLTVDSNGSPVSAPIESYGGAAQDVSSTTTIEDGGLTLHIVGNGWKKVAVPYNVTPDTVLDFDFSSGAEGEIHGIGFDTDDTIDNPIQIFELLGTQTYGDQTYHTYSVGSGIVHYTIPVGTFYTGNFLYLTFTNDHDVASPTAESIFSNISISEPSTCTSPCFDLFAVTGETTLPGLANPVPVWGYNTADAPVDKPGGPELIVNQGDVVTLTLHNSLTEQTSLLFQGQNMIPDLAGIAPGGMQTYTFTANKPGTFLYEAGLLANAQHQVAMGLYGALIVRPTGAPSQAYATGAGAATFDSEQVLVLSELDTDLNNSADPGAFDIRKYSPKYYLINGEAYPDTAAITVAAGETVLFRYVNAGLQAHSMSTLGLSQNIVAQDGHANTFVRTVVAETIATGQTLDTLVNISGSATQFPLYDASLFLRNNVGNGSFAGLGGMLTMITVGSPVLPGDTTGPIASALDATPNTSDGTLPITISATISDASTGNSNVTAAEFYIDNTVSAPVAMSGSFGTPTVSVSGTIPASTLEPGSHTIYVRGLDSADNYGSFATVSLTIETGAPVGDSLYFSTSGITTSGPGGVGADNADIYFYDGSVFSQAIDFNGANVDGFDQVGANEYYVSFAVEVTLPGGVTLQKEDVAHFDGTNWSVFFDGTANGLGASNIDAISVVGGTLYFSTSDAALPTGAIGVGDDADIYSWDGSTCTQVYDATMEGWSGNNVDGLVFIDADHFYLSYSPTSTVVSGLGIVQDEDVVYYNSGVWSMYFDGTSKGLTTTSLDADAADLP